MGNNDLKIYYKVSEDNYQEAIFGNKTKRYTDADGKELPLENLYCCKSDVDGVTKTETYIPLKAAFEISGNAPDAMMFSSDEVTNILHVPFNMPQMKGSDLEQWSNILKPGRKLD